MRIPIGGLAAVAASTAAAAQFATKTQDYAFAYTYPAAARRIAPLRTYLAADSVRLHVALMRDVADARVDERKGGFPFRAYRLAVEWKVVAQTPRYLSLSGRTETYSGGAHGEVAAMSLLWDKKAGRRLATTDLFVSPTAVQAALGAKWCAWRDAERTTRIGATARSDRFFGCPAIKDLTVLLGSSNGRRIDRIGLIANQYVAGSYAEGPYETTLPVTASVLAAVKPAYRMEFAVR